MPSIKLRSPKKEWLTRLIQCESLPTMTQTDKTEEETRKDSIQVMPHEGQGKKKHEGGSLFKS